MASKIGNAAAAEARGVPEFDLLASGVDREKNSTSESTQAASSITVTVRGPAAPKRAPPPHADRFRLQPGENPEIRRPRPSGRPARYGRQTAFCRARVSHRAH